jgi:CHAT domain-containing protein
MERYFFKAAARRDKLKVALAIKRYQRRRQWTRRLSVVYLPVAASVLLVAGLSVGLWRMLSQPSDVDKGLVALQNAFKEQRPIEPRISALTEYAPAAVRGPQKPGDPLSLNLAGSLLIIAAKEHPSAASHHALGQYYLAVGQYDAAVKELDEALRLAPQDARTHSDLGAALLEEGKAHSAGAEPERARAVEEYARSIDELNKALKLDGSLREALFNRALYHESMMLPQAAEEDWRKYLELDKEPNSPWALEARRHLSSLEALKEKASRNSEQLWQSFVDAYRAKDEGGAWDTVEQGSCRAGNCLVERLIDEYIKTRSDGRPAEAESKLRMLSYVGELKARRTGDLYALDLARFYKAATPEQLAGVSQARELAKSGQEKIVSSDFSAALDAYATSGQMFERLRDQSEARLAEYWSAICLTRLGRQDEGATLFRRLAQLSEEDGHKWLAVRSLNALADYQFSILHEYSAAIASGSRSAKIAQDAHDTYGLISALSFLMELYRYLGNYEQALNLVLRALSTWSANFLEPKQMWLKYNEISWTLNSLGLYAAAADYQKIALQLALEVGEFSMICATYIRLGVVYGGEKRFDEALESASQALNLAETRSDEAVGQQMLAYASLEMGDLYRRAGDFRKAIEYYDRSIELYAKQNSPTFIYQAYKGMLLSHIAAGDTQAAREKLATTLALYDKDRANILEQSNRNSFTDVEYDVFDVAIDFEYSSLNDPEEAFNYSEKSRARSLLDLLRSGAPPKEAPDGSDLILPPESQPMTLAEVREKLPEQTQILQYSVLEDKIIMWVISKRDFRVAAVKIEQQELDRMVRGYLQMASRANSDPDETGRLARELYDTLIRPVESFLDKDKPLCIVPDKILNYVPYASLISPTSGKYLLEDYVILLSPSSSTFLECSLAKRTMEGMADESLLSIGNPDFDHSKYPDFPDLPESDAEAKKIAAYYKSSEVFTWDQAVKSAVVDTMARADVINIASHSIIDESSPMKSKLLLAKSPAADSEGQTADDVLDAAEIYRMKLPRARLVVLSSCQTGTGRSYRGEGVMSIARPFIAAGVPQVVASLWSVESGSTAEMMIKLHEFRRRSELPSAAALRQAQLAMLHGPDQLYRQPYYWAAFNIIGGYTRF